VVESIFEPVFPRRVIGLVPAAGYARRLGSLPCSKEVYPIQLDAASGERGETKAVGHYLLEKMRCAGIREALIIIRNGKWDVPEHFKDGAMVDIRLAYLLATVPWGVPYTLDQAYPFVRDALVALGFPDILFTGDDAYKHIIARQAQTRADVVLGLFPTDRPSIMDVVDVDHDGRIDRILSKPAQTTLTQTWGIAVWAPSFTAFLHDYLTRLPIPTKDQAELSIGEAIQVGIEEGLSVEGVFVSNEPFLDIGIPENFARFSADDSADR